MNKQGYHATERALVKRGYACVQPGFHLHGGRTWGGKVSEKEEVWGTQKGVQIKFGRALLTNSMFRQYRIAIQIQTYKSC